MYLYLLISLLLVAAILVYFRIAEKFNIIDVPNHRSSHQQVTIRGAGIIFPLAAVTGIFLTLDISYPLLISVVLISAISFIDDMNNLSSGVRLGVQLLSSALMLYAVNGQQMFPFWLLFAVLIVIIGAINAFNFMDGINGITGIYALVALLTMWYINKYITGFANNALMLCPAIACVIFLYFNYRPKARCFAGDVGSVSIAFWLLMLQLLIIRETQSYKYLFLFSVYTVDAVLTILKRLTLKENILQAHRRHVYQLLVNNGKLPHLFVALTYGTIQLLINFILLNTSFTVPVYLFIIIVPLSLLYWVFERRFNNSASAVGA
ncbi:glycosyltransferase family 4 protein [Mucilaginibacter limnophilus]|uniref:Glycosyltransferase family 4 protein n=1 Tax=Mucilaginibacter limnophilus TaxID=1932778 RepID=A0A437MSS9_9SPHI|nr:glycosyltransferase family 4 protein [Mucilaginibacter limnophilus]RVU00712.1 glycosyltransferase family 4 protein [Mucilaginibacter limnophilus]